GGPSTVAVGTGANSRQQSPSASRPSGQLTPASENPRVAQGASGGPRLARGPAMRKLIVLAITLSTGCMADLSGQPGPPQPPPGGDDGGAPPVLPTPDMAQGDASCGGMAFALTRVPPNVMLVLDRSGSMSGSIGGGSATTKWTDLKNAVQSLVTNYDSQVRL